MQGICFQRGTVGLVGHFSECAAAVQVNDDGAGDDGCGPPGHFYIRMARIEATDRFPCHPGCREEKEACRDEGRYTFQLFMPVMVGFIRWLV